MEAEALLFQGAGPVEEIMSVGGRLAGKDAMDRMGTCRKMTHPAVERLEEWIDSLVGKVPGPVHGA